MDTLEVYLKEELKKEIAGFVVSGASKRGWTTWLTAAVDDRVKGIAPAVYDNLDLVAQMKHQKETWGNYSRMIAPYTKRNIPEILLSGDKDAKKLAEIIDPLTYTDRISVPKYIMIGTNDPYWPLDALNLYIDSLGYPKHIYYMANAGHGLEKNPMTLFDNLVAFHRMIRGDFKFADVMFQVQDNGIYVSSPKQIPVKALLWKAGSETRDFRKASWTSTDVLKDGKKDNDSDVWTYAARLERISGKYGAAYVELVYETDGTKYSLCTNVKIVSPLPEEKEDGQEGNKKEQ
jgi:PhoPQ-activated pathogenicity-related protein